MSLSSEELFHLGELARLHIGADESARLLEQLRGVVDILGRLAAVDTTGVLPMTHPQVSGLRLRDDRVTEPDRRDEIQAGAPAVEGGLYLVPRVVE